MSECLRPFICLSPGFPSVASSVLVTKQGMRGNWHWRGGVAGCVKDVKLNSGTAQEPPQDLMDVGFASPNPGH